MRAAVLLCFCFVLLHATQAAAQSSRSKKANKAYNKAFQYKGRRQDAKAEEWIQKSLKADPGFLDAWSAWTGWLVASHRYNEALEPLKRAYALGDKGQQRFARPYARSLLATGHTNEALEVINRHRKPGDTSWNRLRDLALTTFEALSQPADSTIRATPVGIPWRINSHDAELFPSYSSDGRTLYFTRRVGGMDEDLFYARPDTCGGWLTARAFPSPPNTPQQEAAQMISADGHYLFYMRCDNRSVSGYDLGGCDLYMAYTADTVWSAAQSFGGTINTPSYEGMPCLAADNRALYFASDRAGGFGGLDLYVARFESGLWQLPKNLGPAINTSGNETAPFLHPDGQTLYFTSDGHPGMGGTDLYYARRAGADTLWEKPKHMGVPFNSPFNEASMTVTPDGRKALFSSDRDSIMGNFDIYEAPLPLQLQPLPVTFIRGYSYDSLTQGRLNYANIYISDSTGKELYQVQTNRGDGSYQIALPSGQYYPCTISRIGYSMTEDTLWALEPSTNTTVLKNFALLPYDYVAPKTDSTVLVLHFPKNSATLTDSMVALVRDAIQPWAGTKDLLIMVNGFTDNTGTPMLNEQLSYRRARLVTDAIIAIGNFAPEAVQHQGWGEATPIMPNDTEEGRDANRRVEVIIRK